jgi:hypothetical protein
MNALSAIKQQMLARLDQLLCPIHEYGLGQITPWEDNEACYARCNKRGCKVVVKRHSDGTWTLTSEMHAMIEAEAKKKAKKLGIKILA